MPYAVEAYGFSAVLTSLTTTVFKSLRSGRSDDDACAAALPWDNRTIPSPLLQPIHQVSGTVMHWSGTLWRLVSLGLTQLTVFVAVRPETKAGGRRLKGKHPETSLALPMPPSLNPVKPSNSNPDRKWSSSPQSSRFSGRGPSQKLFPAG